MISKKVARHKQTDRCFPFSPRRSALYHTQTGTQGDYLGKFQGICSRVAPRASETPAIQANVTVWKHQSINKTLLCGSKGFQHHGEKKRRKKKSPQRLRISPESERKRPRVGLKRENCYHYGGKSQESTEREGEKKISKRRNNQDGYFSARYRCSPCIIKIDCAYNFTRGRHWEIKRCGRPHCWVDRYQTLRYCSA